MYETPETNSWIRLCALALLFFCACAPPKATADLGEERRDSGSSRAGESANESFEGGIDPDLRPDGPPVLGDGGPGIYGDAAGQRCTEGDANLCPGEIPPGCGTEELCGNGLDEDCDGQADEDCSCSPGAVQRCFLGPPGRRGHGACADGMQRCLGSGEFGGWSPCEGGIRPSTETCDHLDNDCNGCPDDGLCCDLLLSCPGPGDPRIPNGQPFHDYPLDGTLFFPDPAMSWKWEIKGGPCDELLYATSLTTSFMLSGANAPMAVFHPTLSGDYTVTMTVIDKSGKAHTCTFVVHIAGPGLRVELCWDTTGQTDIDLHLHRSGTQTPWFGTGGGFTLPMPNPDDCFFMNCVGPNMSFGLFPEPDWGYLPSPLSECEKGPNGSDWIALGACRNPRLDIDNIDERGKPENANLDAPREGETFRIMTHFFGGSGIPTHPLVNVYCGGNLTATFGAAPDLVPGFDHPGDFNRGLLWRVADVTTHDVNGQTSCDVASLHPPGSSAGYWVMEGSNAY